MKKFLIISLIALSVASPVFADDDKEYEKNIKELQRMQDQMFIPSTVPLPDVNYTQKEEVKPKKINANGDEDITRMVGRSMGASAQGMPLFKQLRIKLTNYYKIKAHEDELKEQQELQKELMKEMEAEDGDDVESLEELTDRNLKKIMNVESSDNEEVKPKKKFAFWHRKKNKDDQSVEKEEEKPAQDIKKDTEPEKSPETLELSGGVKQVVAEKDAQLDCDVMNYYEDRNEIEATGHPVLYFPPQGVTLKADKLVYNTVTNIIKAYDNVELIKDGSSIYGDFIQINMNEETSLITNMKADKMNMVIRAKKANAGDNLIVLEDGKMYAEKSFMLRFKTRIIGSDFSQMQILDEDRSYLDPSGNAKVKVVAKEISVNAKKNHDLITVKEADIKYNDFTLRHIRSLTAHTNKKHEYFEANYPEFGSRSRIGMFAGPGFVFDVPNGATIKAIPFLNYKDGFGIGGALKYRSGTNFTEMMYGSAEDIFVLRGAQQFDDKFFMQYGMNSYMDNWWLGSRMAKYMTEFVFRDGVRKRNFLGKNMDLTFKQRLGAGYIHDSDVNRFDEKNLKSSEMGTTRLQYMSEIDQTLYTYNNPEKRFLMNAGVAMQGAAAVYGTGDTQFVGRIGPRLHTQYKYWMQDIGYFLSAYQDNTPVPRFDTYRYGHSNVYIREALRLCKYASVSWAGSFNLSDDAPNGKMVQENIFMVALGPDDFKVSLGYDFFRQTTYFTINVALDMKGTTVDYDKMVIKNPDRLAQDDKQYVKEVTFEEKGPATKVNKTYAEVINIEDPDKEAL